MDMETRVDSEVVFYVRTPGESAYCIEVREESAPAQVRAALSEFNKYTCTLTESAQRFAHVTGLPVTAQRVTRVTASPPVTES